MGVIRLAVDAMGGDFAPAEIVAGAVEGARRLEVEIVLVGDPVAIQSELDRVDTSGIAYQVAPAAGVIGMGEEPAHAVRSQPEASINVACRQVLEGKADGVITMGHTGAGMIAALFNFGRLPGVERPAVIVPLLGLREDLFLIDAGANSEVRSQHLIQFAQMGSAYLEHAIGIRQPRVGLLSNGAEPNKGNAIGRETYSRLAETAGLNFIGNVEGHALFSGQVNLIVADGFVGNVLLKSAEGIVTTLLKQIEPVIAQLPGEAGAHLRSYLDELQQRNDYARHGVAALLGVQQPIFIGHGRSQAAAVINGMGTARRMIAAGTIAKIRRAVAPP